MKLLNKVFLTGALMAWICIPVFGSREAAPSESPLFSEENFFAGVPNETWQNDGWTDSFNAVAKGNLELVKALFRYQKVDRSARDAGGGTLLHCAAARGRAEIVDFLLKNGFDLNTRNNNGLTALHYAVFRGEVDVVKRLLSEKEIAFNAKTKKGWTPLHYAVGANFTEIVKLLLAQKGIEVNAQNIFGWTPLHVAADKKSTESAALLLGQKGVQINANTAEGNTFCIAVAKKLSPLHFAVRTGAVEIVRLLLTREETDVNIRDSNNDTPLCLASRFGSRCSRLHFIELCADRPELIKAMDERMDVIRVLLGRGDIEIDAIGGKGLTSLCLAVSNGYVETVKMLLDKGADVNRRCGNWTPLTLASSAGHGEIVELLLEQNGIDLNEMSNVGTAFDAARDNGHFLIARRIREKGGKGFMELIDGDKK